MSEFEEGRKAYLGHKDCPADASEDFKNGFGEEYERAEILTNLSEWGVQPCI